MLKNKNAIVTGSTSGIGEVIATKLAELGCNVMLNGFGDKAAIEKLRKDLADKYKVKVEYSAADMSKPADIEKMIADANKAFGGVDILVNDAGIQFTAPVDEFPADKWDSIIAINLSAYFHTTKHVLPIMKKQKFGRIVNIISVHGLVASIHKAAYVSAKHGVAGLTKVVALETAQENITCNGICPGWVLTPLVEKQIQDRMKEENKDKKAATDEILDKQPTRQFVEPADIAAYVVFLCGENSASITGAMLTIDGGWTAE